MTRPSALSVSNLSIRFGGITAVNNVTLALPVGCRYALIGPNGAGKTTFVNLLSGALSPTGGEIWIGERNVTNLKMPLRTKLGLSRTYQINMLFPRLTSLEAIALAITERENMGGVWWKRLIDLRHVMNEAQSLLEGMRLIDQAKVPIAQLAYGKQRLLEIALALASKPRILLMDEPAAGVPPGESREVLDAVARLPDDISILFIEHDMDLVFRFAERIIVLTSGAILAEGGPEEIKRDERVRAAYLGSAHV